MMATTDIESAARECAGNHAKFDSFCWYDRPDDNPQEWGIVYTHNRDSGIIDRCNGEEIGKALAPFIESGDVCPEHHTHWACGWVDGFSIRVFRDGTITEAFRAYVDLRARMEDYPILNEERVSEMETKESAQGWEDWARADFLRALAKRFRVEALDEIDRAALKALFDETCNAICEYWYDDGSGMTVRVDKVAEGVELESALPFLDTTLSDRAQATLSGLLDSIERSRDFGLILAGASMGSAHFHSIRLYGMSPRVADECERLILSVQSRGLLDSLDPPALADLLVELQSIARALDA